MIFFPRKRSTKAQTTIELAVFGSILIFLVGVIVRTVLQSGQSQNQNYKAFRMAMTTSFRYSEGLVEGMPADGTSSRNTASVLVIEDRLSATSARYGTVDRTSLISAGSATHSRNLFYPMDFNEYEALPVTDYFINGEHFPLTIAGFKTVALSSSGRCAPHTQIPNHPALPFSSGCEDCFDLDRDGTVDVDVSLRPEFSWQWQFIPPDLIDAEAGNNTAVDVDCDLKEESVLERSAFTVKVLDFQEGDIDSTINDRESKPQNGLATQDAQIFTRARNTASGLGTGTYLQVDQGKLYSTNGIDRQFVRTTQQKDSLDVVQRVIQLNKNTGHFCTGVGQPTQPGSDPWGWAWNASNPNPVEACVASRSDCFGPNTDKTCMVLTANPVIFVRSRIEDKHGRKWVTDTEEDGFVELNVPRE